MGVTGQDGSYLAEFLPDKGCIVHGVKRKSSSFKNNRPDHIFQDFNQTDTRFKMHYGDLSDSSNLNRLLADLQPDEVCNLASQNHVAVSFSAPEYTGDVEWTG